jgi:Leucine-rich repeat (LRR) protein
VINLPGSRVRDIDALSSELFLSLREINLENNSLSSIQGLSQLTTLITLKLSNNRIERIEGIVVKYNTY